MLPCGSADKDPAIQSIKNKYYPKNIFRFIHDFRAAKISDRKYRNLIKGSAFIKELATVTGLPLTSYFLNESEIKKC